MPFPYYTQPMNVNTSIGVPTQGNVPVDFDWNAFSRLNVDPNVAPNLGAAAGQPNQSMQAPSGVSNFANIAQGVGAIADAWLGFQNLGLARDSFNFNRDLAQTNLANQAATINRQLEDQFLGRQNLSGNTGRYESLEDYMRQNAVSGRI